MRIRAWQLRRHGEPEQVLEQVERELPAPGPGELQLSVRAAALGLPDVFLCRGSYAYSPPLPFVPGQEVAGIVRAVGAGVTRFRVGERVMAVTQFIAGHGGFASATLSGEDSCFRVPESMSDAQAAGFQIAWQTAWIALVRRGQLRAGETLAVVGAAGGTGLAAVRLGAALGARVIAVAGGAEKLAACREEGAALEIDSARESVPERLRELTGGRGVDLLFDPVGGADFAPRLAAVASEGRALLIGFANGPTPDAKTAALLRRNTSLVGVMVGAYGRDARAEFHEELLARFDAGRIAPRIHALRRFEELPAALAELAARRVIGKIVLQLADSGSEAPERAGSAAAPAR